MKISLASASIGAVALALVLGVGIPALGQDRPESLLPPGFDETPAPVPAPAPAPAPLPAPAAAPLGNESADTGALGNESAPPGNSAERQVDLTRYDVPPYARHSLQRVGVVATGNAPLPRDAFGAADGRYLATLMRRLNAPIPSRWLSIALRRTLISRVDTPPHAGGADFAAERVWLLLRMGEANAARALIQDVDNDDYTPMLHEMGMQTALATGDPEALCPIVDQASARSTARAWPLAQAMCLALAGKPNEAGKQLDDARRGVPEIDWRLAEKVVGAGAGGRRAVTIQWDAVDSLSAWRYGLAAATGVEIPDELFGTTGAQARYWFALSPIYDPAARAHSAELAAAQGIFSNAGLVDLYGEISDVDENGSVAVATARDLRTAYTGADAADRIAAMHTLWDAADTPRTRYARLVLTARAAANIAPDAALAQDADKLIASMLTAGIDGPALAWRRVIDRKSDGWAMLALADPNAAATVTYNEAEAYRANADPRKGQLFAAALAGLGVLSDQDTQRLAQKAEVAIGAENTWTRAIVNAARRRQPGTVVLLAAVGMQTRDWSRISPEALFHIVAALRVAGLENYARMIAVEAISRA